MRSLQQLKAFSHFTDHQIEQLADCTSRSPFPAGSVIVTEGDTAKDAYAILQGRVHLQRETSYGLFSLTTLEEGDLFGELGFVDGEPRSMDAVAQTDVVLAVFNALALSTLSERDPTFTVALYWAIWNSLSSKLRETNDRLTRFFSDAPPDTPVASAHSADLQGNFRINMEAKRALFREQRLANMEINLLASLSRARKLEPNERLFSEGDAGDRMYVVAEGRIMISKHIPGAGEEALAFLERGDFFGEMALIDHQPRSADAKADAKGAVVLSLRRQVIETLLDINKVSSIRLLRLLCRLVAQRLREVDEKILGWYILSGGSPRAQTPGG